jgi:curved DNA-binding protein CbpA
MKLPDPNHMPCRTGAPSTGKSMDPLTRLLLEKVDSQATIAELGEVCGIEVELAQKIIYRLADLKLVTISRGVRPSQDPTAGDRAEARAKKEEEKRQAAQALERDILSKHSTLKSTNYYDLLEVEPEADRKAITRRYFDLSKRFHPDRVKAGVSDEARQKSAVVFRGLTKAYDTLSNPGRRAEYDEYIAEELKLRAIEKQLSAAIEEHAEEQTQQGIASLETTGAAMGSPDLNRPVAAPPPEPAKPPPPPPEPARQMGAPPEPVRPMATSPEPAPQVEPPPEPARPVATTHEPLRSVPYAKSVRRAPVKGIRRSRPVRTVKFVRPKPGSKDSAARRRAQSIPTRASPKKEKKLPKPQPEHEKRREEWKRRRANKAMARMLGKPSSTPPPPTQYLTRIEDAKLACEQEQYPKAIQILKKVLLFDPHNAEAQDLMTEAEGESKKILAKGYLRQGRYEKRNGQFDKARSSFDRALKIDPDNIDAQHMLAELLVETRRDLGMARTLVKKVITSGGRKGRYYATLGEIYLLSDDFTRAKDAFERALKLDPENKLYKKRLKLCTR